MWILFFKNEKTSDQLEIFHEFKFFRGFIFDLEAFFSCPCYGEELELSKFSRIRHINNESRYPLKLRFMCFGCIRIVDDAFVKGLKAVQYWDSKLLD